MDELRMRYELSQLAVFQNAPEEAGLFSLHDKNGVIVYMEYANNIAQRLQMQVPRNQRNYDLKAHAKTFSFFITQDTQMLVKLFDGFVQKHGHYPICMKSAPPGSAFTQNPAAAINVMTTQEQVLEFRQNVKAGTATPGQLVKLARQNLTKGHAEKALQLLERAKGEGNEDAILHLLLGHVLLLKGRQQAIQQWQRAAELDPRGKAGRKAGDLIKQYMRVIADQKF